MLPYHIPLLNYSHDIMFLVIFQSNTSIVHNGYRFSANLDNPAAIAKGLAQQPGKAKACELRQGILSLPPHLSLSSLSTASLPPSLPPCVLIQPYVYVMSVPFIAVSQTSGADGGIAGQQMKEAIFLQEVRQAVAEERANQLRW